MNKCITRTSLFTVLTTGLLLLLAACDNGSDSNPGTTTLAASVSSLVLAVNGTSRTITITNMGTTTALSVAYTPTPDFPLGTIVSASTCGTLPPAASCVLTVTPGATPTAAVGDVNPSPVVLSVAGANTNTVSPSITVLDFGSVYQGGYVFAIDDTTPDTSSIGGKVAALTNQAAAFPNGIIWSSNGNSGTSADVVFDNISGIDETSTPSTGTCNGNSDGACDTQVIISQYSPPTTNPAVNLSYYAAGLCSSTQGGYSDWYLPAICEMGYDTISSGTGCGTASAPTLQNMQSNLVDNGDVGGLAGNYWSSTEYSANPTAWTLSQIFATGGASAQSATNKGSPLGVRCVRVMTN